MHFGHRNVEFDAQTIQVANRILGIKLNAIK
jgi:hypothetical protein